MPLAVGRFFAIMVTEYCLIVSEPVVKYDPQKGRCVLGHADHKATSLCYSAVARFDQTRSGGADD